MNSEPGDRRCTKAMALARPGHQHQSISKANFVTSTGWRGAEGGHVQNETNFGQHLQATSRRVAWLRFAALRILATGNDARKCAIQSWNLNNGNKNYEHEYFNVVAICIRKPLRGPTPALNSGHKMKSPAKQRNLYGPRHQQQPEQHQQHRRQPQTSHCACPIRSIRGVYCCLAL